MTKWLATKIYLPIGNKHSEELGMDSKAHDKRFEHFWADATRQAACLFKAYPHTVMRIIPSKLHCG
jgi:hypothetical protein